ncbi:MAG TPA: diguanylate cyclase [Syntrophales bacterium]|nr:diguanylate cyclase [Syntrophales bacterium]
MKRPVGKSEDELRRRIEALEKENNNLKSLLLTDELTGLYNKRFFYIQLDAEASRTRRTGQPCTLMMMDVDNFKLVNDALGHDAGDRFLTTIGGIIKDVVRVTDFACRFGGDEFSVIMPTSTTNDCFNIAKRIHNSVAKLASTLHEDIMEHLSVSLGLATYEAHAQISVADFFRQADSELYEAKKMGKNQISFGRVTGIAAMAVSAEEKTALAMHITNIR